MQHESRDYFEFELTDKSDNKTKYKVSVSREHGTNCAILSVEGFHHCFSDQYCHIYVPLNNYYHWSEAGIDDANIAEMYSRGMIEDLNECVEMLQFVSWDRLCEAPTETFSKRIELLKMGMPWERICSVSKQDELNLPAKKIYNLYYKEFANVVKR